MAKRSRTRKTQRRKPQVRAAATARKRTTADESARGHTVTCVRGQRFFKAESIKRTRKRGPACESQFGRRMSHKAVETVIGKLVTDEQFRQRFFGDPTATLDELRQRGCEVTSIESEALLAIDPAAIDAFASVIDPRLQKLDCRSQ